MCALYWLLPLPRLASHRLHIPPSSSRTCLISYPSLCPLLHTCWFLGSGSLCSVGHFSSRLASYHLIALRTHACTHITSHHTSILARRNISISSCCISTSQTHSGALSLSLLRIYLALGSKVIMLTRHRQLNTQKDIITSTSLRLPATAFARREKNNFAAVVKLQVLASGLRRKGKWCKPLSARRRQRSRGSITIATDPPPTPSSIPSTCIRSAARPPASSLFRRSSTATVLEQLSAALPTTPPHIIAATRATVNPTFRVTATVLSGGGPAPARALLLLYVAGGPRLDSDLGVGR